MDELQRCRGDEESIRKALHDIPDSLEDIYKRVLTGIRKYDEKFAQAIFNWLSVSKHPLTQQGLAKAAGLKCSTDIIPICSSTMVSSSPYLTDNTGRIEKVEFLRLAHPSVNEYLLSARLKDSTDTTSRFFVCPDCAPTFTFPPPHLPPSLHPSTAPPPLA